MRIVMSVLTTRIQLMPSGARASWRGWFEQAKPEGGRLWGVVREQLLLDPGITYTSHNSSACAFLDFDDRSTGSF